ncbi:helix-turn-helix domain-containing protein [Rhizobium sp. K102]|uniref:helix-turn-helix domain-containing protein n=1 Tax=Rhizobium sp. K102 TaxID=2918527 RepID=UPI001EFBB178|nr:helix-turn-helix domain-containing protein [Rhizobium sp. K102]ULR47360.1 helix-turn-helix domain-containing protein [Rhizobium sp. K102]
MSVDIGSRLRHLRLAHKLSQRELAKRTGVPNSTISLIESNASNPSVGALKRILDGIPIGLAEFFAFEPERPKKAFYAAEELVEIGKGAISYKQVGETLFGRSLQILKECYQPAADTGKIPLVHEGEEGGIVLSGRPRGHGRRRAAYPWAGRRLLFRKPAPASVPLRRTGALRGYQRLHAADVLTQFQKMRAMVLER